MSKRNRILYFTITMFFLLIVTLSIEEKFNNYKDTAIEDDNIYSIDVSVNNVEEKNDNGEFELMKNLVLKEDSAYSGLLNDMHADESAWDYWRAIDQNPTYIVYAYYDSSAAAVKINTATSITGSGTNRVSQSISATTGGIVVKCFGTNAYVLFADGTTLYHYTSSDSGATWSSSTTTLTASVVTVVDIFQLGTTIYSIVAYDSTTPKFIIHDWSFTNSYTDNLYYADASSISAGYVENSAYYFGYKQDSTSNAGKRMFDPTFAGYFDDIETITTSSLSGGEVHPGVLIKYHDKVEYLFSEERYFVRRDGNWSENIYSGTPSFLMFSEQTLTNVMIAGDLFKVFSSGGMVKFGIYSSLSGKQGIVAYADYVVFRDTTSGVYSTYQITTDELSAITGRVEYNSSLVPSCQIETSFAPNTDLFQIFYDSNGNLKYQGYVDTYEDNYSVYSWTMKSPVQDDLTIKVIERTYSLSTVPEIIKDIIDNYCLFLSYSSTSISTTPTQTYSITFKNKSVGDILQWAAKAEGYLISIRPDLTVYFNQALSSGITIDDANGNILNQARSVKNMKQPRILLYGGIKSGTRIKIETGSALSSNLYIDSFSQITSETELSHIASSLLSTKNITYDNVRIEIYPGQELYPGMSYILTLSDFSISTDTHYIESIRYDFVSDTLQITSSSALILPTMTIGKRTSIAIENLRQDVDTTTSQLMAGADGGQINLNNKEIWLPDGATFSDLQDAINTLNAGSGGTIHLPVGTITCTSNLALTQPIKIVGHGIESTELISNVASTVVFSLSADGCTFQDFKITLDPSATYAYAFYVNSDYNVFVNVFIIGDVDTETTDSYGYSVVSGKVSSKWINCYVGKIKYAWYLRGESHQLSNCISADCLYGVILNTADYCNITGHQYRDLGPSDSNMYVMRLIASSYNTFSGGSGYFTTGGSGLRYLYHLDATSDYNKIYALNIKDYGTSSNSGTGNSIV